MGSPTHPFWISAFLDVAPERWDTALEFWPAATGTTLSALRGGLTFCFVSHPAGQRPRPVDHGGHRCAVDQVCIDAPASLLDAELAFWAALTGWPQHLGAVACFTLLQRPADQPIRLLMQTLDDESPAVSAHLDMAVTDRAAETARHTRLGAEVVAVHGRWTVLRAPDDLRYCLTDRDPDSGRLID